MPLSVVNPDNGSEGIKPSGKNRLTQSRAKPFHRMVLDMPVVKPQYFSGGYISVIE